MHAPSHLARHVVLSAFFALGMSACLFQEEPSNNDDPAGEADAGGGGGDASGGEDTGGEDSGGGEDPLEFLDLPDELANYAAIQLPAHYAVGMGPGGSAQALDNTPAGNPITDEGATLGRVLFYDEALSANGTIACASCHRQDLGFNDDREFSQGFEGGLTGRHSMNLTNARFYGSGKFFWDERADTLEDQVLMPFQDEVEMGLTLAELEQIVASKPYYAPLFEQAFGDDTVDSDRISRALAQFVRSMVSANTRYDEGRAQVQGPADDFPNFTAEENLGKRLFFGPGPGGPGGGPFPCAGCHATEAFVGVIPGNANAGSGATNNGLDATTTDEGAGGVTGNPNQDSTFKVGSLRNIEVGAPYMHDGRFATLREVVDHYSEGIQDHPTLAPQLRVGGPEGAPLRYDFTDAEKDALVAFLETLTDDTLNTDARWSDPFPADD
jgi:cytochrome c peroxidase